MIRGSRDSRQHRLLFPSVSFHRFVFLSSFSPLVSFQTALFAPDKQRAKGPRGRGDPWSNCGRSPTIFDTRDALGIGSKKVCHRVPVSSAQFSVFEESHFPGKAGWTLCALKRSSASFFYRDSRRF